MIVPGICMWSNKETFPNYPTSCGNIYDWEGDNNPEIVTNDKSEDICPWCKKKIEYFN